MKKFITLVAVLFIALLIVISVVGCGGGEDTTTGSSRTRIGTAKGSVTLPDVTVPKEKDGTQHKSHQDANSE
jgi:uncharacterized lipoprotein YehR (DUF1307 family)